MNPDSVSDGKHRCSFCRPRSPRSDYIGQGHSGGISSRAKAWCPHYCPHMPPDVNGRNRQKMDDKALKSQYLRWL
jgi:hypothetical protein